MSQRLETRFILVSLAAQQVVDPASDGFSWGRSQFVLCRKDGDVLCFDPVSWLLLIPAPEVHLQ